ncbi:MAG: ABC transporter substrate-binding protein, partial [Clostridia bacterium]
KNAFSINVFENAVEEKFPDIDIIQVGNYSCDMGIAEYEARIKNDDLTDIVMTWPLDVGEQYWSERLMDLSSWSLSGKYATSMLNNIARDGKLYYLPGPSQVRSILYNKTLFAEKGWTVPTDFESFISLCHSIENSGIRSLQLGLGNSEVFDTAFTGFGYDSSYSSTRNAQFISNYNLGNGNFVDNFAPALETFQRLVDEGILKPSDLDVYYQDRERMLFNRECAMVEDSVLLARAGNNFNGCTDEFALMPFFNPGEKGDWARLYPVCYVGVNKHLEEPKNSKKLSIVKDILEYISTVEGQQSLSADTGAMFSSLLGTTPPDIPEIKDLVSTLNNGRYAVFNPLKNAQVALREGLKGIVRGNKTIEDVCAMVDKQNRNPPIIAFHLMLA